ncbi:MAG: PduL/EutD family phosphate acyltransferase [Ruminococcus sp.]|nr:PduL/EutD family phosphate acyltransferase [Ruminococcus sp.]
MKKKEQVKIYGTVAISNHHLHLTKEVYEKLFDEPLSIKRPLNQIGEYASFQTVTLKTEKDTIENVRIIGPFRPYNQVEISRSDARKLGLNPPVRESGDLEDSEAITIVGKTGEVTLDNACIQAERHVHMNKYKAEELGLKHEDLVKLRVDNDKGGDMEAIVKVSENGYFEIHIDVDDANAFLLKNGDEVEIIKQDNRR